MRKHLSLTMLALVPLTVVVAQTKTGLVKGRVMSTATGAPATDVQVSLPFLRQLTNTDADGYFELSRVPYGDQTLVIGGGYAKPDTIRIQVASDVVVLNDFSITPNDRATSMQSIQIPTIALEEADGGDGDDGAKTASVSGLLSANRDPFLNAAAFVFGQMRFQPRGYDRNAQQVLVNGAPMNDVETNDAYWNQWGGLNDVFRGRSNSYGLQPSEYAYGGLNGTVFFDATAASQRRQTRITYSAANRQYRNRIMVTHNTGLLKNGWALSVSGSRRWAEEGYVKGTIYDSYSYYLGVSKKFNDRHMLSFTTFGAPTDRGRTAAVFKESVDITGDPFYNPNWGYQQGKVRNARIAKSFQPVFQLTHEWNPNEKTNILTTLSYQTGKTRNTGIDWYNAPDPRPDYYRNMPHTYQLDGKDPATAPFNYIQQVQWDNLVQVNKGSYESPRDTQNRSLYVIGEDVDDINKIVFNTIVQRSVSEYTKVTGGISFIKQRTESYRELVDLLGGDFYRNLNQFASFNNNQGTNIAYNNVNDPNTLVRVGDKYLYNYINNFNKGWAWGQFQTTFNKVDVFMAANLGFNSFNREGLYRNGLYATGNQSYGKSETLDFLLVGVRGGATYKLNGRNYVFLNAGFQTDAPTIDNTFISPRIRNTIFPKATEQKTYTMEGGYLHRAPSLNLRAVGYVTDIKDEAILKRFFKEGTGANTFTQYLMSGVASRFIGTELAAEWKVSPAVSLSGVAAIGQAFYTNRPDVYEYEDYVLNSTGGSLSKEKIYIKNYNLATGPQSAYTVGINYRSPKYWYANLNLNYYDRSYVDIAPTRHTEEKTEKYGLKPGTPQYNEFLGQEKLPSAFTMDIFFGKSFLLSRTFKALPRNTFLYINAGISNILDNRDIRTSGFENLRLDDRDQYNRFQSKYFYAFGRNFFVNVSLKF